jgi:hypothetical protein
MNIEHFDDLLTLARAQPTRQRLLVVFARAELPDDATEAQRRTFEQGVGGALAPAFCVDKEADELSSFTALQAEAAALGQTWDLMFVAALGSRPGQALVASQIDVALEQMVAGIQAGQLGGYLPFDPSGQPVRLA